MTEFSLEQGLSLLALLVGVVFLLSALLSKAPPWLDKDTLHNSYRLPLLVACGLFVGLSLLLYRQSKIQSPELTRRETVLIGSSSPVSPINPPSSPTTSAPTRADSTPPPETAVDRSLMSDSAMEYERSIQARQKQQPASIEVLAAADAANASNRAESDLSTIDRAAAVMGLPQSLPSVPAPVVTKPAPITAPTPITTPITTPIPPAAKVPPVFAAKAPARNLPTRTVSMRTPAQPNYFHSQPKSGGWIEITIDNQLDEDQQNEMLELVIEGRSVGRWDIDRDRPISKTTLRLPRPGLLNYQLMGTSLLGSGRRALLEGVGCLTFTQGKRFEVRRLSNGQLALQPQ